MPAGASPDWLNLVTEETLEPDLAICDPHHHLWDYPDSTYLLPELLADTGSGHNVVSTVFVECDAMFRADGPVEMRPIGETEFVNGVAAMAASGNFGATRAAAGIVSYADLNLGHAVGDVLDAHMAVTERFKGIRHAAGWDASSKVRNSHSKPDQHMLASAKFREGFAELGKRNLSFDSWLYHTQISELTDLARAFPDTCPNVHAKLGGLVMAVNGFGFDKAEQPPTSDALVAATRPWYDYAIEVFGADRCMFESNFPVDKVSCSYNVLWNSFKKIASGASATEKANLFHDTAASVYRL